MEFDIIDLTQKLIQIPSESSSPLHLYQPEKPAEFEIMNYIYDQATRLGIKAELIEVEQGRPNLYLYFPNPGKQKLLFDNHLDTVSAKGMIVPAFEAQISHNKLWGRGACDVKGSAGVLLSVLFNAKTQKIPLNYDVTVVFTVDEECSFSGAKHASKHLTPVDFGITLEPTDFDFISSHKGVFRFRASVKGKASHSAKPELGENAIYKLIPILEKLKTLEFKLAQLSNNILGKPTFSINVINGGKAFNIVPDECSIECDLRYVDNASLNLVLNELEKLKSEYKDLEIEEVLNSKVFLNEAKTPIEENFLASHLDIVNSLERRSAYFGTDCSEINNLGPMIVWGPGSIEQAHTKDEFIELNQLESAQRILKKFLYAV